jgi:hypothetical protein
VRAQLIIFSVIFAACSGGTNANNGAGGGLGEYSGGDGGCGADTDCPQGMVCAGCEGTSAKTCLPGCRTDDQCGTDQVCGHDVQCVECPCPPGWCEADPCRDQDHDGYVPSTAGTGCALGKLYGDCDDLNPLVHPGAIEVCDDGVDNDCDGKRDSSDSKCQACQTDGGRSCTDLWSCSVGGEQCTGGCCTACPPVADPQTCPPGQCMYPGVTGADGCRSANVCQPCDGTTCANPETVCGVDYGVYSDECEAQAKGVQVLHYGYCWNGEGISCAGPVGLNTSCGPSGSYYCRGGAMRCTGVGFCLTAADCPAASKCNDGGTPTSCVQHECTCDPG